jgi:hypothetical protein
MLETPSSETLQSAQHTVSPRSAQFVRRTARNIMRALKANRHSMEIEAVPDGVAAWNCGSWRAIVWQAILGDRGSCVLGSA